jgi:hypothetical protein
MKEIINLTTADGWNKANKFLGSLGLALLGPMAGPMPFLIINVIKLFSQGATANKQAKAGRDNNVDEMEITMSSEAGAKLKANANLEGFPIDIEGKLGTGRKIIAKIKYK